MKRITHEDKMRVRLQLDPRVFPETLACLELYEYDNEISAYDLATALIQCDKGACMPRCLFDLIVSLYEIAVGEGDDSAMNDLGALYYDGRGCLQDFAQAIRYYDMAAKRGNRQAQENLGYCYYYGRNVPIDYQKAFHYFALGAFDGHLNSLYKIGDMYQNGYYVERNPEEAFRIYSRCLDTMTDEAAPLVAGPVFLRVGNALLEGLGVEQDLKGALICFQKAEVFLYDMVASGDVMYKRSLQSAVDGQAKARALLAERMPSKEWLDGEKA